MRKQPDLFYHSHFLPSTVLDGPGPASCVLKRSISRFLRGAPSRALGSRARFSRRLRSRKGCKCSNKAKGTVLPSHLRVRTHRSKQQGQGATRESARFASVCGVTRHRRYSISTSRRGRHGQCTAAHHPSAPLTRTPVRHTRARTSLVSTHSPRAALALSHQWPLDASVLYVR